MNWDTAIHKQSGCIAFGIVARDCEGFLLGAKCVHLNLLVDPKVAEVMAALHAILFSREVGFFDVVFEGDALQVVRDINSAPLIAVELDISLKALIKNWVVSGHLLLFLFLGNVM